jgi:superfamily II DNA/RNA helicase
VKKGVDILIATPGRLLTLARGTLPQSTPSTKQSDQDDDDIDDLVDEKEFSKLQKLSGQ